MLATDAEADLRGQIRPRPSADEVRNGCAIEDDELAPARGIVLGALLGAVSLGVLGVAGWWLF